MIVEPPDLLADQRAHLDRIFDQLGAAYNYDPTIVVPYPGRASCAAAPETAQQILESGARMNHEGLLHLVEVANAGRTGWRGGDCDNVSIRRDELCLLLGAALREGAQIRGVL